MKKINKYSEINVALPVFFQSGDLLLQQLKKEPISKTLTLTKYKLNQLAEMMLFNLVSEFPTATKIPYAALTALGSGHSIESGYWLRADPTELRVDGGNVYLVGRDHLELNEAEIEQLLPSFNSLLSEDEMQLHIGSPNEWFLQLQHSPEIETAPFHEVLAKDIRAFMPKGPNDKFWHKLLTEFQMILFQHQINLKREKENKASFNNVWIWGEGSLSKPFPLKNYTDVWSDCSLIKGLYQHAKKTLPHSVNNFKVSNLVQQGQYLISFNHYQVSFEFVTTTINQLLNLVEERFFSTFNLFLGNGEVLQWHAPRRKFFGFIS